MAQRLLDATGTTRTSGSGITIPMNDITMTILNNAYNKGYNLSSYVNVDTSNPNLPTTTPVRFGMYRGVQATRSVPVQITTINVPYYRYYGSWAQWTGQNWGTFTWNPTGPVTRVIGVYMDYTVQRYSYSAAMYFYTGLHNVTLNQGVVGNTFHDYSYNLGQVGLSTANLIESGSTTVPMRPGDTFMFTAGNYSALDIGVISGTVYVAYI
jgi:hypothetical protein